MKRLGVLVAVAALGTAGNRGWGWGNRGWAWGNRGVGRLEALALDGAGDTPIMPTAIPIMGTGYPYYAYSYGYPY